MLTVEDFTKMALAYPDVTANAFMGKPRLLVADGKKGQFLASYNAKYQGFVFAMPIEVRDVMIAAEPAVYFTTDHHRPHDLILAHPETVDPDWVHDQIRRRWKTLVNPAVLATWQAHHAL